MSQPLFLFLCFTVVVFAGCVLLRISERMTCRNDDDGAPCWPLFAQLGEDDSAGDDPGVPGRTDGLYRTHN